MIFREDEGVYPLERGFFTTEVLEGDLFLGRGGYSEKVSPTLAVFQVPSAQNNQYATMAYFGVACPELQSHEKLAHSALSLASSMSRGKSCL